MKVLHVAACMSAEWGGPAQVVKALAAEQSKLGLDVQVLSTFLGGSAPPDEPSSCFSVRLSAQDRLAPLWTAHSYDLARHLRRAIRKADLVHVHEIWHHPHAVACSAAKKQGKPYVVTPHGSLYPFCLKQKGIRKKVFAILAQRRYLRGASVLHASTEDEEVAIRMFKVMTPVAVIPNGVDVREFSHLPASSRFEEEYPELIGKTVLLFLARLHPQKGLDMLASAFGRVAKSRGDVHLVLAGPDSYGYRKEIEKILVMNGARERVTFTGMLTEDQKMAALSRANVFVLPSHSEGFSMGILEAMACHLPVLITRPCRFPDVSKHRAGLVIEPNEEQLAESIHALLGSQSAREEMGENGYRLVQHEYSLEVIARRIVRMYERVT